MKNLMKAIKHTLKQVCGVEVDITVRGKNKFTFSFEGKDHEAEDEILQFFGPRLVLEPQENGFYDEETDMTYIYCSFKD